AERSRRPHRPAQVASARRRVEALLAWSVLALQYVGDRAADGFVYLLGQQQRLVVAALLPTLRGQRHRDHDVGAQRPLLEVLAHQVTQEPCRALSAAVLEDMDGS